MKKAPHTAVIGAGSWGTALASLLTHNSEQVTLLTRTPEVARQINETRHNPKYLTGHRLPSNLTASAERSDLVGAQYIVLAVPSAAFRETAESLATLSLHPELVLLSVAKGIERETGLRMTEIIAEVLPQASLAALSGPNHAEEVVCGLPTCSVIGSPDSEKLAVLQQLFSTPTFRSYTSDDLIGIEWGGAVKNTYAIAAGIAKGLALGDNAIAALVTRALAEMRRIGRHVGAQPETFSGLSGVGDLMTTCYSSHSRNHRVGLSLAEGLSLSGALDQLGMVAEGVPNTLSIYQKTQQLGVEAPLIEAVYSILYESKSAVEVLGELLQREPKPE